MMMMKMRMITDNTVQSRSKAILDIKEREITHKIQTTIKMTMMLLMMIQRCVGH